MKKRFFSIMLMCLLAYIDYYLLSHFNTHLYAFILVLLLPFPIIIALLRLVARYTQISSVGLNRLILVFSSFCVSIVLVEVILRLMNLNPTYLERIGRSEYQSPYWADKKTSFWNLYQPDDSLNFFRGEFHYHRKINHLGLAEREAYLRDTSIHKILSLGDSFTEGIGTEADSAWPRVVEHYMNSCARDSYLVYNAGIAGSEPVYEYHLLRNKFWDVKWDAVIFLINTTDIGECSIRGGMERFKNDTVEFTKPPLWEPIYAVSHLVRFVVLNIMHYDWTLRTKSENEKAKAKSVREIAYVLKRAEQELRERGIKMLVVAHPMTYDMIEPHYLQKDFDSVLVHISALKPLDLRPYLRDSLGYNVSNYTNIYWKNDGHFKGIGYQIIGKKIGQELVLKLHMECNK